MKTKIFTFSFLLASGTLHAQGDWGLSGNSLVGTEYLGTNNPQPLRLFTNNTEHMRLTSQGRLGIGLTAPQNRLHINT